VLLARLSSFCGLVSLAFACGGPGEGGGDPGVNLGVPPPAGKDKRIREIADPKSPTKANDLADVAVSGAVVVAVDQYDETANGRSRGTIYVQDLDVTNETAPYSAISLFAPSFIPGNLRVAAGDVLDLRGTYQETKTIGPTVTFTPGAPLPQLAQPIATFRFDAKVHPPRDIDVADLKSYDTGRKWLNMLVRVKDVTLERDATAAQAGSRISAALLPGGTGDACDAPFPKAPVLVNELMDLNPLELKKGQRIKSITGVVTYFCNFHIAPRSPADIEK
jgi:hypothetical protein